MFNRHVRPINLTQKQNTWIRTRISDCQALHLCYTVIAFALNASRFTSWNDTWRPITVMCYTELWQDTYNKAKDVGANFGKHVGEHLDRGIVT